MARKDFYHNVVRRALEKDGWSITHEPVYLPFLDSFLQVDLGAERLDVQKEAVKIAVEVKNFRERKDYANEFHKAIGQIQTYMDILSQIEPARDTYLAIPVQAHSEVFSNSGIQAMVKRLGINLVVFDPQTETIIQWNA